MRYPKTLIRVGFGLLVVITVLLVVRTVFNTTEGRALTRALAELKAQGVPLAAADLAPACPDEDNGARLWKAAENLLVIDEPPKRPQITPMDIKSTGRSVLSGAFMKYAEGRPIEAEERAALLDLAAKNVRVFELMSEAAAKPCFLSRDPGDSMIDALSPGSLAAIKMLRATHLLGFAALFSAEEGDVPGALDRIRAGLKFATRPAEDGALITYLVAVAGTRSLAYFLRDICSGRPVGDDALSRLIEELDPIPWRERLSAAWRGERVIFIEAADRVLRGGAKDVGFLFGEPFLLKDVSVWLARPLLKSDIRKTLPLHQELETLARVPYHESRDRLRAMAREREARPWYAFLSGASMSGFESAHLKEAVLEANLLAARTGLACRLHKSRTGEYPAGLEALVPVILSEVPTDPFTGRPLVYRRDGEGFIVYSLGSNQKDDGGRSTYNITGLVMDKDDDWSWREPR